ncbi:unnamed protein product [Victoria cruziana]
MHHVVQVMDSEHRFCVQADFGFS